MYDILITIAEKDFVKLRFLYDSILINIFDFSKIHIISNVEIPMKYRVPTAEYHLDEDVIDFDFNRFTGNILKRQGWYKQQFIKLFQEVTQDNYLVIDSDVVFLRPLSICDAKGSSFFFGKDQYNSPYFELMTKVLKINKAHPHSFINEIMFFQRSIIKSLLKYVGVSKQGFFDLLVPALNEANEISGFSEYEMYGNYVKEHFPDAYAYVYLRTESIAKKREWTKDEVITYINKYKNSDVSILKLHTWI